MSAGLDFDAGSGRLLLDATAAADLVAWGGGARLPPDRERQFHDAGLLVGGRPHRLLVGPLAAIGAPLGRLVLTVHDNGGGASTGTAWSALLASALLLDLPEGGCEFRGLPTEFLPAALARAVDLGPRPRNGANALMLAHAMLDGLLDADPRVRQHVAAGLGSTATPAPWIEALVTGPWTDWRIEVSWTGVAGARLTRKLHILDTSTGLLQVEREGGTVLLQPTHPTRVWRQLTQIMPTESNLPAAELDDPDPDFPA